MRTDCRFLLNSPPTQHRSRDMMNWQCFWGHLNRHCHLRWGVRWTNKVPVQIPCDEKVCLGCRQMMAFNRNTVCYENQPCWLSALLWVSKILFNYHHSHKTLTQWPWGYISSKTVIKDERRTHALPYAWQNRISTYRTTKKYVLQKTVYQY